MILFRSYPHLIPTVCQRYCFGNFENKTQQNSTFREFTDKNFLEGCHAPHLATVLTRGSNVRSERKTFLEKNQDAEGAEDAHFDKEQMDTRF